MGLWGAVGGGILGGVVGAVITAFDDSAAEQAKREAQNKKTKYEDRSDTLETKAETAGENAAALKEAGIDTWETATNKYGSMKSQLSTKQSTNRLRIGTSSVKMSGSAEMLMEQNAERMGADLDSIIESADQKWNRMMAERRSTLTDMHGFEESAENYQDMADNIDPEEAYDAQRFNSYVTNITSFAGLGAQIGGFI